MVSVVTMKTEQPWLASPSWDGLWIIAPAFLSTACVIIFQKEIPASQNVPLWVWVCFVLLIDVAHVYATLFRTYFSPQAFAKNKTVLLAMPALAWILGSLLYSIDGIYFWRALAYLAVFHFIRQQFGFMVLYARREPDEYKRFNWIDCLAVYTATIYPVLFWHTSMPRNFSWFVAGDFIETLPQIFTQIGFCIYVVAAATYLTKEIYLTISSKFFNIPKNLLLTGTALSWWTGIITFNSDMAFTITNVVSHGIPYMALVWLYHGGDKAVATQNNAATSQSMASNNQSKAPTTQSKASNNQSRSSDKQAFFSARNIFYFLAWLAALAYLEEGLWDGLVWREHLNIFGMFSALPTISDNAFLALLVPFLALPQSTHYLLDGFIWRVKDKNNIWSA